MRSLIARNNIWLFNVRASLWILEQFPNFLDLNNIWLKALRNWNEYIIHLSITICVPNEKHSHFGACLNKMAAVLQTTFSNKLSFMKMFVFHLKIHYVSQGPC